MGIFGSYAKRTFTDRSDIDIFVEFEKPIGLKFIELSYYLEDILGEKVDLLTETGIKSIRIKNIAKDIKRNIRYV
ncbi:MAG: nucleotidyltransferase domain-containing protein [Spirochaetes bacterium]|nr:nucleotidyltransferase domain-containing protein [Spirochaetota bacterium]